MFQRQHGVADCSNSNSAKQPSHTELAHNLNPQEAVINHIYQSHCAKTSNQPRKLPLPNTSPKRPGPMWPKVLT
jgi:hypothetical protein